MRRPLIGVALTAAALTLTGHASAHIVPTPSFLPSESSRSIDLVGPNERDDAMTGFRVTAPAGVVIEHAHDVDGWTARFNAWSAEWSGGTLAPDAEQIFGVTLEASTPPGPVELEAEQLYADGAVVSWPVHLTVTPADESASQTRVLAGIVALIGVLLIAALAVLVWRRRMPA